MTEIRRHIAAVIALLLFASFIAPAQKNAGPLAAGNMSHRAGSRQ